MSKRPTQTDVAQRAGVSRATVSYVLNDHLGEVAISNETRHRVIQAMNELGYQPDARAQSLRSGDSKTIGLVIPDIHNPHFLKFFEGVEEQVRQEGYDLLLAHSDINQNVEDYILQGLLRRTMSGLIIAKTTMSLSSQSQENLRNSGRPIVELSANAHGHFDTIMVNYREATKEVMAHLLALGHRRFGFILGVNQPEIGEDRRQPYQSMLRQAGIPDAEHNISQCGMTPEDAYHATYTMMQQDKPPTALLVINDYLALAVLRALADMKLAVPQDVSVVGFDNIPLAQYFTPRLTTASREQAFEGKQAVKLLLERLEKPNLPIRTLSMQAKLIIRESTGPAAKPS